MQSYLHLDFDQDLLGRDLGRFQLLSILSFVCPNQDFESAAQSGSLVDILSYNQPFHSRTHAVAFCRILGYYAAFLFGEMSADVSRQGDRVSLAAKLRAWRRVP